MAKFSLRTDWCRLSHHTRSRTQIFGIAIAVKSRDLLFLPSQTHLKLSVSCGVKGKEDISEINEIKPTLINGIRVNESDLEDESRSGMVGFSWTWPPWKDVPERHKIIGTTSLAFVTCNMDKVNLSIAIIPMSHQLGWNASVAGLVQSSFFWGYALSQLPGGWLAKIFGGRNVLELGSSPGN